MAIYEIQSVQSHDIDVASKHIESDMSQAQLADIAVGLSFFIEDNTAYGPECSITEEMVSYLLCNFFGCKSADDAAWMNFINETMGAEAPSSRIEDYQKVADKIACTNCIDLFEEREKRCGDRCKEYQAPIEKLKDTAFIKALCAYFNDEACMQSDLTLAQILEKY